MNNKFQLGIKILSLFSTHINHPLLNTESKIKKRVGNDLKHPLTRESFSLRRQIKSHLTIAPHLFTTSSESVRRGTTRSTSQPASRRRNVRDLHRTTLIMGSNGIPPPTRCTLFRLNSQKVFLCGTRIIA